jgi:hypothetical protein
VEHKGELREQQCIFEVTARDVAIFANSFIGDITGMLEKHHGTWNCLLTEHQVRNFWT